MNAGAAIAMTLDTAEVIKAMVTTVRMAMGWSMLSDFGILEVSGTDAAAFLQSQTTHDVAALTPGHGQASALVDRKAHLQAYFTVYCLNPARFWLVLEKAQIPATMARLDAFLFAEAVEIKDVSQDYVIFTLQGPESVPFLAEAGQNVDLQTPYLAAENISFLETTLTLLQRSFTGEPGYLLCLPATEQHAFAAKLKDLPQIRPAAWDVLRIEAGLPQYGRDMDVENLLPETGLEQIAVSYNKGCYQGQEVIARIRTYGSLQKAMVGLVFDADASLPPENSLCLVAGNPVGTVKSVCYSPTLDAPIALAYLSREFRVPNKTVTMTLGEQTYSVKIVFLPFYTSLGLSQKAKTHYDTGLKLFAENEEIRALAELRKAIACDPHLVDAYEVLGVILSRHNQEDEAIALMQKLAEIEPEAIMPHTNLSVFYMKKGLKEEAEQEKAIATTLQFKAAIAASQQGQLLEAERKRQEDELTHKIAMYQEVLALDAEDELANYGLGNLYVQQNRFEEAVAMLQQALAKEPKYTVAYLALGKALEGLKKLEDAKAIYEKGIEVAAKRGDLMPMKEMQQRLGQLNS